MEIKDNLSLKTPVKKEITSFRAKLLKWHRNNKRYYPWRGTQDPFRVLIAEMMLRRTKADQVKRVYERLFNEYPDIQSLSKADNKKLEDILGSLGLRWRLPSFGLVAREIMEQYGSKVPDSRSELKKLTGVGDYVAGAVLSIAYHKKEWMVDSNVVRVLKRYFGIITSKEGRRKKEIIEISKIYVSCKDPREANLAILDFAAIICKPRHPLCPKCPLRKACHSFSGQF